MTVRISIRYGLEGMGIESRFWKSIFVPIHTDPEAHLVFCTYDAGSLLGIQRPERGNNHALPRSTEVANISELYVRLLSMFVQACHKVNF